MNQPNQQQNKQQPTEWKPDRGTVFLLMTDDEFTPRARRHVIKKYGQGIRDPQTGEVKPWHIETNLNPAWLKQSNSVVVLYSDPSKGIWDESLGAKGEFRERDKGEKQRGERIRDPEPTSVLETKPIDIGGSVKDGNGKMCPLWREEGYSDGVDALLLCTAISRAVHPRRAQLTKQTPAEGSSDPAQVISVRAV